MFGLAGQSLRLCARQVGPRVVPKPLQQRGLRTSSWLGARLGRITPKRVAVVDGQIVDGLPRRSVGRPILFAVGLSLAGFTAAALYENHDAAVWGDKVRRASSVWRMGAPPTDTEIFRAKQGESIARAQESLKNLLKAIDFLPSIISVPIYRSFVLFEEWKINTDSTYTAPALMIIGMAGVMAAFNFPRTMPFMRKWFMHRPVVFAGGEWRNCVTMFTSTIAHQQLWHFACNSIALYTFGSAAYAYIRTPDPNIPYLLTGTFTPEFCAFLLSAGLFASLGSHLFSNLVRLPRLMRVLQSPARLSSAQALATSQAIAPSLGASGAIYAAVTLTAMAYPSTDISLIFLPFFSIPIGLGVAGMVTLDLIGILRGWRMFDHVAHFSGAMYGIAYWAYGKEFFTWLRMKLGATVVPSSSAFVWNVKRGGGSE